MRKIVLTPGERFGKLTLIAETAPRSSGKRRRRVAMWRCDCGVTKEMGIYSFVDGSVFTCGCVKYRDETPPIYTGSPAFANPWEEFNSYKHCNRDLPVEFVIDESGCWICTSHAIGEAGYPQITYAGHKRNAALILREFMDDMASGPVSRHTCDNRLCIRPDHIIGGTHRDNVNDKISRGRQRRGEAMVQAKLSAKQVHAIFFSCEPLAAVCRRHNVRYLTGYKIRRRESWRHLTGEL